ncbi:MAG: DUF1249 domain-containing protein [Gammaproteobacteria bacterium]|nr:DUF1249 domain-containing protein [Gammaproteobacteria bacterium]
MSHTIAALRARDPMWIYERNYALLTGLFSKMLEQTASEEATFFIPGRGETKVRVVERCRYTITLVLTEAYSAKSVPEIKMQVRLYNDARVTEVISYQGFTGLLPKHKDLGKGNPQNHQEKRQANLLLHDWLVSLQKSQVPLQSTSDCPTQ